jgi:hypothetical protein
MKRHVLPLVAVGLLIAADDSRDGLLKEQMAKFQGTWKLVSVEIDG